MSNEGTPQQPASQDPQVGWSEAEIETIRAAIRGSELERDPLVIQALESGGYVTVDGVQKPVGDPNWVLRRLDALYDAERAAISASLARVRVVKGDGGVVHSDAWQTGEGAK